jgi:apolipoprotein N-acyltransferase
VILLWTIAGAARHGGTDEGETQTVRVGFVQAVIALERRHSRDAEIRRDIIIEIENRTRALVESGAPDVVVWSEGMLPFAGSNAQVGEWIRVRIGAPIVIGGLGDADGCAVNRAFIGADPARDVISSYDKRFLVLFGERIPARGLLEALGVPVPGEDLCAGEQVVVTELAGVPVGFSICFEGILGVTGADLRASSARLHVNLTEDLWYGDSSAPRQHLALTRMRAVEAGLPLARVTNGGISAFCDQRGRWLARFGLGDPVAETVELSIPRELPAPPPTQWVFRILPGLFPPLLCLVWIERRRRASLPAGGAGSLPAPPVPPLNSPPASFR